MSMENKLGFNNGDRGIEEVAMTINNFEVKDFTNSYVSSMNFFGSCSGISYGNNDNNDYEVF